MTRQADAALVEATAASGRRREEVIAGLLRLVTVDEEGRPTRWRVPRDALAASVIRELDAFVRRRLVITDTQNGTVVLGVAHEAFLSAWTPLAQATEENVSALRDIADVHHAIPLATLTGHHNTVHSVAFSPDGHTLASASYDNTARLWETNVDRVAARICNITPSITKSEWNQYLAGLIYQPPCE